MPETAEERGNRVVAQLDDKRRYSKMDLDEKERSEVFSVETGESDLVQSHLKDDVDINTIVRRFGVTQDWPAVGRQGVYGDFTGITDYQSALEMISKAEESFMKLPPDVRERFENDPGKLVAYASGRSEEELRAEFEPVVKPVVVGGGVEPPLEPAS